MMKAQDSCPLFKCVIYEPFMKLIY